MSWPTSKLGILGEFRNGLNYSKANFGTGLKVISVKDFADRSVPDLPGVEEVNPAGLSVERALLQRNDIIFVRSNGNRALVGRSLRIDGDYENLSFSAFCIRFRLTTVDAVPEFLAYFFRTPTFRRSIALLGKGTNISNLNQDIMQNLEIPVPPVRQQQRIVDILSRYDDLIENNRRRMELLEEAARQLYREWFGRLRFPGHEHSCVRRGAPEGWERRPLGELCEEIRDTVLPDVLDPETPYIGLEHMPRRSISLSSWGTVDQVTSSKHRFKEGEILFGKIRPYFHKVGIAFVGGVASSDTIIIRPLEEKLRGLVLMAVSSDAFVGVTAQAMREGSKMPRADWKQMKEYLVPVPPDGLLSSFEGWIDPIVSQLKTLTFTNQKLRAARDLLLPPLMNGEIEV